eukprot:1001794-Alexandrium_andersonii.AAC.1
MVIARDLADETMLLHAAACSAVNGLGPGAVCLENAMARAFGTPGLRLSCAMRNARSASSSPRSAAILL